MLCRQLSCYTVFMFIIWNKWFFNRHNVYLVIMCDGQSYRPQTCEQIYCIFLDQPFRGSWMGIRVLFLRWWPHCHQGCMNNPGVGVGWGVYLLCGTYGGGGGGGGGGEGLLQGSLFEPKFHSQGPIFSCDQAALQMVFSVCPSVSVCLSVCHTFLTMFSSSYHHEIFRSYYQWPK